MKNISVLGSTGSIGQSALDLVDLHPDRFRIVSLAAQKNTKLLYEQCLKYTPKLVALHDHEAASTLRQQLPNTQVLDGLKGVVEAAVHSDVDLVLSGISGAAGLIPTYEALLEHKDVALANKETLVMAGELITELISKNDLNLLPVDSEHTALHQCLRTASKSEISRLVLTASGGPFWNKSQKEFKNITIEEALKHPTWKMGEKITIDSATLMNKGLEIIEAHYLFGIAANQISVVVHPQSTVHSMVEFIDGTILAQMSITDMRSAILYALSYPERWDSNLPNLDLFSLSALEFFPPNNEKFPCIRLAYQALESGQTYPTAINAANEISVHSFLDGILPFSAIPQVIEDVMAKHSPCSADSLETILKVDLSTRAITKKIIKDLSLQ